MSTSETNDSGESVSVWMGIDVADSTDVMHIAADADVCVVGAGIAGLSTAYELLLRGFRVVVVDDGPIGGGETARTTAHLSNALDDRFVHLARLHGEEGARLAAESHAHAITRIETIAAAEGIDCELRRVRGYLMQKAGEDPKALVVELTAARRAGVSGAQLVERAPIPGFDSGPALMFPDQAELNPVAYMAGLARAVRRRGGVIVTDLHVKRVDDGAYPRVVASDGRVVTASFVVVATNAPITSLAELPLKQSAYRSYAIALVVPEGSVPRALYWDTEDPYHYVRVANEPTDGRELLIVGGEDHKTGQDKDGPAARFERLLQWTRERFPLAGEVVARWSGQILEPIDGLAFIGLGPGNANIYVITGDSGHGLTHGVIGSIVCSDLITGRPNPWATLYDPSRRTLRALGTFLQEGANTAAQYADWLTRGDGAVADIPGHSGAVIRRGASKLAVYRDADGACHERSAVCPHLGGIVSWNEAEKTWDCPCHGSRFDAYGRVISGPAVDDLKHVDAPAAGDGDVAPESGDRVTNPWLRREGA
jgi:glycine/D-amino acid oxidase-like deaminating enzyme/nitrite reductase/ring-hydroxylating ferredoxin subunit